MNVSLYQAAAAMSASARWQDVIAQNLSAASIPGYKKQDLSFAAVQASAQQRNSAQPHATLPAATPFTNFAPGEMKPTGVNTDMAIEGPGFFEVQLPDGSQAYTRDGEFQVNAQGQLATKQGYLVLGDSGPIQLDVNNPNSIAISPTGQISQGGDIKGALKIASFQNPALLTAVGGGLFEGRNPDLRPADSSKVTIRQGCLEGGNTTATTEMANLITAMRSFEANQRVIQLHDDRLGKVISELGNPNA